MTNSDDTSKQNEEAVAQAGKLASKPKTNENEVQKAPSQPHSIKPFSIDKGEIVFALERAFPTTDGIFSSHYVGSASNPATIIAIDTNALLLPYKIGKNDLGAVAKVYRDLSIADRLFLPERVAREFVRARDRTIAELLSGLQSKKDQISLPDRKLPSVLEGLPGYEAAAHAAEIMADAHKAFVIAHNELLDIIRKWRADDPVSNVYQEVFVSAKMIAPLEEEGELLKQWEIRRTNMRPPGYKDGSKDDSGIGDYLIWKSLLRLGKEKQKDLIFITGEEKADWFIRVNKTPVYPRAELIEEYYIASGGKNLRLATLAELLAEMKAPDDVVEEVRAAETEANSAIQSIGDVSTLRVHGRAGGFASDVISFDYSTFDGRITLGRAPRDVTLGFSKASTDAIHLYKVGSTVSIARVKYTDAGERISFAQLDSSSRVYTINVGEGFLAQRQDGLTLSARIISISDDSHGSDKDDVTFKYTIFDPGSVLYLP